jgi:hypothetical protein
MSDDGFEKVQQQMESTLAELKVATDPIQRRMLLGRMSWLLVLKDLRCFQVFMNETAVDSALSASLPASR